MAQQVKNLPVNVGDTGDVGSIAGLGRSPGGGNGSPLQHSCLKKSHGERSLVGYSPWGHKELDMAEQLNIMHIYCCGIILKMCCYGREQVPVQHMQN